jgi:hypothetical protein
MRAHPGAHVMASVISDGASVKLRLAWLARLARILRLNGIYAFAEVPDATEIMSTAFLRRQAAPHVVQNDALTKTGRRRTSAIDKRTTRHVGYRISPSCRAMVECIFGWANSTAPCARPSTAASPPSAETSCSISSPTISSASPSSSPPEP